MNIAMYLRLSMSDGDISEGDKTESNSIENQRFLLRDYLLKNSELDGEVIEYVDDGYSGANFNRPAFQQMITDAKSGFIKVIIAKDLSRLGRDYVEMGDYLDQIFPRLGVRVIAVCSGYDSRDHEGDVSGIDAAITNFINSMYIRDLSLKHKSAHRAEWMRGVSSNTMLPYGYYHDKEIKLEWQIDDEAAEVVRFIFDKAAKGWRVMEIAEKLNEMGAEVPGARKARLYNGYKNWIVADAEYLWDYGKVRKIITDETYTGSLVAHRTETTAYDFKKVKYIPKEEWVIVKNHHEPLVDRTTFENAQAAIIKLEWDDKRKPAIFSLKKKLRCGNCRLAFRYVEDNKKFFCKHKLDVGSHSQCSRTEFSYPKIEKIVFEQLKKYLNDLKYLELIMKNALEKIEPTYEKRRTDGKSRLDVLKAERIRQYEGFAEGKISKEEYLRKKKELNEEIECIEADLKALSERTKEDGEIVRDIVQNRRMARIVSEEQELTKKMVDCFIENVYVYDDDRLEIKYSLESLLDRTIKRNNEIMETVFPEEEGEAGSHHYDSDYVKLLREKNLIIIGGK